MKTILIISGGTEAIPGILRAKAMGLHVVVSDQNCDAPGFTYSDDRILASTYDVVATVAAARDYHRTVRPINGVICMAADVPLTVASVAAALGLPGLVLETARLAADKLAMKQCFIKAAIPVPWFNSLNSAEELRVMMAERDHALVVKPVDSRGARGVLRIDNKTNPVWTFEHAQANSPTGRVMVEEYLAGPQISTESVMIDGRGFTSGFIDRNYEFLDQFSPYMIENGGEQPTVLTSEQQLQVTTVVEQGALAMGIENGIAKGDMVLTENGPKVIEIAARLSGGWMSSDQIPLGTGVDIIAAAVQIALGEQPSEEVLRPQFHQGVAIRYFFPPPGKVTAIINVKQVEHLPWVHRLGLFVSPGEIIHKTTNHTKRAGFVITTGKDRNEAVQRAQQVVSIIDIQTEVVNG